MSVEDELNDADFTARANEAIRSREHFVLLTADPSDNSEITKLHLWKKGNRLWMIGAMVVGILLIAKEYIGEDES